MRVPGLARALSALIGVLLLMAAAGKLTAFASFVGVLSHLGRALDPPAVLMVCAATIVVACEFYFGTILILGGHSSLLNWLGDQRDEARMGLLRNATMLWVIGWLFLVARPATTAPSGPPSPSRLRRSDSRPAFTLLEILVVIAVIAVVIALAVPSMMGARQSAKFAVSLSLQQQLHVALTLYAGENTDALPYFGTPGDPKGPRLLNGFPIRSPYFTTLTREWVTLLVPGQLTNGAPFEPDPTHEYQRRIGWPDSIVRSRFKVTATAFAAPAYFASDQTLQDPALLRGTLWHEVAFPSSKGITFDTWEGYLTHEIDDPTGDDRVPVGRGDGSVGAVHCRAVPHTTFVQRWMYGAGTGRPIWTTRDGLAGRDFP